MRCLYVLVCLAQLVHSQYTINKLFDTNNVIKHIDAIDKCGKVALSTEVNNKSTIYKWHMEGNTWKQIPTSFGSIEKLTFMNGYVYAVARNTTPPYLAQFITSKDYESAINVAPGKVAEGVPLAKAHQSDFLFMMADRQPMIVFDDLSTTRITNVQNPVHKMIIQPNKDTYLVSGPDRQAYAVSGSRIVKKAIVTFIEVHGVNRVNDFCVHPNKSGSVIFAADQGIYYLESFNTIRKFKTPERAQTILITMKDRVFCLVDNEVISFSLDGQHLSSVQGFTERERFRKGKYFTNMFVQDDNNVVWFTTRQSAVYKLPFDDALYVLRDFTIPNLQKIYAAAYDKFKKVVYVLSDWLTIFYQGNKTEVIDKQLPQGRKSLYVCTGGQGLIIGSYKKVYRVTLK